MQILALAACSVVALSHIGFLVLEMFLWQTRTGLKVFRQSPENAAITAVLAKNQGLYNGFLAVGILFGIWLAIAQNSAALGWLTYFLACVVVAGVYGAATVNKRIFAVQALPAIVALALCWAA